MGDQAPSGTEDIIEAPGIASRMISADHLLETGKVPIQDDIPLGPVFYPDYQVDWKANDAYVNAVKDTTIQVIDALKQDSAVQKLLEQKSWDQVDRGVWEKKVAETTHSVLEEGSNSNLTKYRNDWLHDDVDRTESLNDLSPDIKNNTTKIENDCDTMTITQTAIMQKVDNMMLPEPTDGLKEQGDYKHQGDYYITYGRLANIEFTQEEKKAVLDAIKDPDARAMFERNIDKLKENARDIEEEIGKKRFHTVVISPQTGGVIESMHFVNSDIDTISFAQNADPLKDFAEGKPIVMPNATGSAISPNDTKISATEIDSIEVRDNPNYSDSVFFRMSGLSQEDNSPQIQDTLAPAETEPEVEQKKEGKPVSAAPLETELLKDYVQGPDGAALTTLVVDLPEGGQPTDVNAAEKTYQMANEQTVKSQFNIIRNPPTENTMVVDPTQDPDIVLAALEQQQQDASLAVIDAEKPDAANNDTYAVASLG